MSKTSITLLTDEDHLEFQALTTIKPVGGQAPWPAGWRPRQPLQIPKAIKPTLQ